MSPPRITIQLVVYIIMFELHCAANLVIFYQTVLMRPFAPDYIIMLMRVFKWFHHFSPLALLYFHPLMLRKFRGLVSSNQSSVATQRKGTESKF